MITNDNPTPATFTGGYLSQLGKGFDTGVSGMNSALSSALSQLQGSPSDPTYLAQYQEIMSDYNLYRNAQTSSVKAMKDIDSSIVGNFR
ncbi:type III secretion system needle filament subunit SctF [Burkholderia ubonensis]|uniref:type III secretion system needle filament subunit SctF n=1 Tax=Burkholderia ubonensis TaxID=101571 RepID=UPI000753679F|nr:type III secretion system needle filament subunit SctF [Burkholderia ubonensis]KVC71762.1 type III secretion system protein PrgI [Burkholderia ubonensis]